MELVLDYQNPRILRRIIQNIPKETTFIKASIAYSTSDFLLDKCIKGSIKLDWWGLFNQDMPIRKELINQILINKNLVTFYPIRNNFHPKIIFFENYGVYIGSANMSQKALNDNIEGGVFIQQLDLQSENFFVQINDYFEYLENNFTALTHEDGSKYIQYINSSKN